MRIGQAAFGDIQRELLDTIARISRTVREGHEESALELNLRSTVLARVSDDAEDLVHRAEHPLGGTPLLMNGGHHCLGVVYEVETLTSKIGSLGDDALGEKAAGQADNGSSALRECGVEPVGIERHAAMLGSAADDVDCIAVGRTTSYSSVVNGRLR